VLTQCARDLARQVLSSSIMLGELKASEIEDVLRSGRVGRIGCHAEGRTYVVPTAYAYDGECIYGQSADGMKVRTMRSNANICFEVDDIRDVGDWRSVIAWGCYEELWGRAEQEAAQRLRERFADLAPGACARPSDAPPDTVRPEAPHARKRAEPNTDEPRTIYFRLRLTQKTGRFERSPAVRQSEISAPLGSRT
jgi:nitroimidazol reductase NimA-like FMN-containing flavoprotein (pyridoxamine 5'-phosphate oxidase superfamily)